jgi:hypothetical protein
MHHDAVAAVAVAAVAAAAARPGLLAAVPIKVLANFKRVKALTKDLDVVVAALAASPLLQVCVWAGGGAC